MDETDFHIIIIIFVGVVFVAGIFGWIILDTANKKMVGNMFEMNLRLSGVNVVDGDCRYVPTISVDYYTFLKLIKDENITTVIVWRIWVGGNNYYASSKVYPGTYYKYSI